MNSKEIKKAISSKHGVHIIMYDSKLALDNLEYTFQKMNNFRTITEEVTPNKRTEILQGLLEKCNPSQVVAMPIENQISRATRYGTSVFRTITDVSRVEILNVSCRFFRFDDFREVLPSKVMENLALVTG